VRGRKRNEEHLRLSHEAHGGRASFGRRKTSQSSVQGVFAEAKPRQKRIEFFSRLRARTLRGFFCEGNDGSPRRDEHCSSAVRHSCMSTADQWSALREGRGYAP
jgi:hypothetical protein